MAINVNLKTLTPLLGSSLSSIQTLTLMKEDIEDTLIRQCNVLDLILEVDDTTLQGPTLADIINQNGNLNFEYNQKQKIIYIDNDNIYIATVGQDALLDQHLLGSISDATLNWELEVTEDSSTPYGLENITGYLTNSIASTRLLDKLVDAAIYSDDPNEILSRFSDTTSDFIGTNSSNLSLRSELMDAIGILGSTKDAVVNVMATIYKNLASMIIDINGDIKFNNTSFYVQGFIGSAFITSVIALGGTIVSAVLAAINPILGAISYVLTALISWIINKFSEATDTGVSFDYSSPDYLFAMPIVQKSIDKDLWVTGSNNRLDLFNYMTDHGNVVTVTLPTGTGCLFYRPSDNTVNFEFYLTYLGEISGWLSSPIDYYLSSGASLSDTDDWFVCPDPTLENSVKYTDNWYVMLASWFVRSSTFSSTQSQILNHTGTWAANAWLPEIMTNLFLTMMWFYSYGGKHSNISVNFDAWSKVDVGTDNINDFIGYFYSWYKPDSTTHHFNGWVDIVNTMVPALRINNLYLDDSELWTALDNFIFNQNNLDPDSRQYPMNIPHQYYYIPLIISSYTLVSIKSSTVILSSYFMDRRHLSMYPPKYAPGALAVTIMAIVGVAALATAAAVAFNKIKWKVREGMSKRYFDVQDKQATYVKDKTDENWDIYWSALRGYNWRAGLLGYSKLSYISGWETGEASTGTVVPVLHTIREKAETIIGDDSDASISDNSDLIKRIIQLIGSN